MSDLHLDCFSLSPLFVLFANNPSIHDDNDDDDADDDDDNDDDV